MPRGELVVSMTAEEARACVTRINGGLTSVRQEILSLYRREGWRALGYAGFLECARSEFDLSRSHLYRQLKAVEVEVNISLSPRGDRQVDLPEKHARELAPLEPEAQRRVYQEATRGGPATAQRIRELAQRELQKTEAERQLEEAERSEERIRAEYQARGGKSRPTLASQRPLKDKATVLANKIALLLERYDPESKRDPRAAARALSRAEDLASRLADAIAELPDR